MFKPNRVGTPFFHNTVSTNSIATLTPFLRDISEDTFSMNNINAAPAGVGPARTGLNWKGTAVITANKRVGLGYQYTVTQPLQGSIIGIELTFSLQALLPAKMAAGVVFGKLAGASSGLFAGASYANQPTPIYNNTSHHETASTGTIINIADKTQILYQEDRATIAGTFATSIQLFNNTASSVNLTWFNISMGVRQLTDQADSDYVDTLR